MVPFTIDGALLSDHPRYECQYKDLVSMSGLEKISLRRKTFFLGVPWVKMCSLSVESLQI